MSASGGMGGHERPYRGETDTWLTPPDLLAKLGPFDLDPCAAIGQPWPTAKRHYTEADDGLAQPWEGRVWLNPPYGPRASAWLQRMADHGNGIALVFARTETRAFAAHVWPHADAMLFLEGRLHFYRLDGKPAIGSAGAPSVLIAYGERNVAALRESGIAGAFIVLPAPAEPTR